MKAYFEALVGKLFKILPMRESEDAFLGEYLDSLWIDMSGAYLTLPDLQSSAEYISMLNIVGYLTTHAVSVKQCKREVFKLIGLCEKVKVQIGGDVGD